MKLGVTAKCNYKNALETEEFTHYNHSGLQVFLSGEDIEGIILKINLMDLKSGAKLDTITDGSIDIYHYNPICVGSYLPTPKKFAKKMAIVNIKHNTKKEDENLCFHYSILAYKYYDSL